MAEHEHESTAIARLEEWKVSVNDKLDAILDQTRRTNGRVSNLEKWRAWLTGGVVFTLAALSAAGTVLAWVK